MIGKYCREYRIKHGIKLRELTGDKQVKTLSAFEMGRSSNIEHLKLYVKLSIDKNDMFNFMTGLAVEIIK